MIGDFRIEGDHSLGRLRHRATTGNLPVAIEIIGLPAKILDEEWNEIILHDNLERLGLTGEVIPKKI